MSSPHKKSFAAEQLRRQKKMNPVVWVLVVAVVVVLIVTGYTLYQKTMSKKQVETKTQQINSIAVLPFRDMSSNRDQEYLGEGIAEMIINALTNVEALRVIASTSSFEFKGKENAIGEIGEKLNVDAVLEGSVQKSGNRLRITAQLIKVSDQSHLFSKTFDREFDDIFTVQDDISHG